MSARKSGTSNSNLLTQRTSRREFVNRGVGAAVAASAIGSQFHPTTAIARQPEPVTITFWHGLTGGDGTEEMTNVVEQFNAENELGITVEATAIPGWDEVFTKWVVSSAAGNPPDVIMYHPSEMPEFTERGMTVPLDDLAQEVGIDFTGVNENVMQSCRWEDELYAIPNDTHQLGLYFNTEMVEQAGLDPSAPPKDGEQFLEWAQALTVRDGDGNASQYGLWMPSVGAQPRWVWYSLLYQFGGSFLDEEGKAAVNSDASRQALQFLVDLIHEHGVVPEAGMDLGDDPMASGRAAMHFQGPWVVTQRLRQEVPFATAALPMIGSEPAAWTNSHCQSLSRKEDDSKYLPSAQFMKWFYEHYYLPARTVGLIPASPAAREHSGFVEDERYPYYEPFITEEPYLVYEPQLTQYTSIFSFAKPTPLSTNFEAALAGRKPVDEALEEMKQGIDEQLEQGF